MKKHYQSVEIVSIQPGSNSSHKVALRSKTQLGIRKGIEALEQSLRDLINKGEVEQTIFEAGTSEGDDQADHYFGDNVYCRSLLIPEGTTVVGKIHKQRRICIIAQGKCTFTDEFGGKTVEAPYIQEFEAGSKTAVYAHTDTLWVACLGTDYMTPKAVSNNLLLKDYPRLPTANSPHLKLEKSS